MSAIALPEGTPRLAQPGTKPGEIPSALAKLAARENRLVVIAIALGSVCVPRGKEAAGVEHGQV